MDRDKLDNYCERGILGLVLAILVFGPLATGAVRTLEFLILQALTLGVLLLWIARIWLNPKTKFLLPPLCWAVLAFAGYALFSYFRADVEYIARREVIRVLLYAFLFFAIVNNLHRQESATVITFTLVFLGMGIAGYAIYQFATGSDYVWHFIKPYKNRGSGTYICPNHLAGFLEMILPLGFAYALAGRLKPVTRIVVGYACLVILAGIVVSISRGAWLSTGLAMLLLFGAMAVDRRFRLPALVVFGALIIAAVIFVPRGFAFQQRARQLIAQDGQVRDGLRFAMWEPALRMWQDNPWFGVGPAHFDVRFPGYRPNSVQYRPDRVHNDYLNTLTDWGIVGAGIVAAAWMLAVAGFFRTWRLFRRFKEFGRISGSNKLALVLGAAAGLTAILAHSVVDFNLHIPANAILAVTLLALLSGHLRFATERYWFSAGIGLRSLATLLLIAGVLLFILEGVRRGGEYAHLARAERAEPYSDVRLQHLKAAFAAEPRNPETPYKIGEILRRQSQEGGELYQGLEGVSYADLAQEAIIWFDRSAELNPWDAYPHLGKGWCLDWLKRHDESPASFDRALQLDPASYYVHNQVGLHYVELGNYAAAREFFQRSIHLEHQDNSTAKSYLVILEQRLLDLAAGDDLRVRVRALTEKN